MDQDVDSDKWLAERRAAIQLPQRLLSTNVDMYRPGQPHPPPTTTQQTSTGASKHKDLLQLCSRRVNSSTMTELMKRIREEGLTERRKYSDSLLEDRRLDADQSSTDKSQEMQAECSQKNKSPRSGKHFFSSSLLEPNDAPSRSIPNAQYLARLGESSRQHQEKIDDMKSIGLDINIMSESGHVTGANSAAALPSPASEKQQMSSLNAELKRTESLSSEDLVEMEIITPGSGRSGRSRHKTTTPVSKNLVSERKRRKKLNDGLYSLRALVPKISKMDKASIVGDAIDYVRELKQEVEDIESELSEIERKAKGHASVNESSDGSMLSDCEERASLDKEVKEAGATVVTESNDDNLMDAAAKETENTKLLSENSQGLPPVSETRILNMEVDKLDEQMYHLKISCQRKPGVLVQLTQALESLDVDVLNAYHTSFQETILNTFIVEMKNLDLKEAEDVRRTLLDVTAQHGLVQASSL